jgi:hypothetical protein
MGSSYRLYSPGYKEAGIPVIHKALKQNWRSGLHWWAYSVAGTFGLWGMAVILLTFQEKPQWFAPFDHGELFLYGSGFTAPSFYILQKERDTTQFPLRGVLTFVCLVLLLVAVIFFAGVTLTGLTQPPNLLPRIEVMRYGGFVFLVVCMAIGFLVTVLEEMRSSLDWDALGNKRVKVLEKEWDETHGGP